LHTTSQRGDPAMNTSIRTLRLTHRSPVALDAWISGTMATATTSFQLVTTLAAGAERPIAIQGEYAAE